MAININCEILHDRTVNFAMQQNHIPVVKRMRITNIGDTNGGDITKQNNIDKDSLELVDVIFSELLDKIYEQPLRSSSNLAKLKAIARSVSRESTYK